MGQRMPDEPIEYGDDCLHCFTAGKTPKYVYARFGLMEACPPPLDPHCLMPPNDRVFRLTQRVAQPCRYFYQGAEWRVHVGLWQAAPGQGWLRLEDTVPWPYFEAMFDTCPDEGTVLHNDYVGCLLHDCIRSGIGIITWNPQATALLQDINMSKARDLFMELRPLENGNLVYKFTRLQDATNIKILFEP